MLMRMVHVRLHEGALVWEILLVSAFHYLHYLVHGNRLNHLGLAIYAALCMVLGCSSKIEWQIIAAFWLFSLLDAGVGFCRYMIEFSLWGKGLKWYVQYTYYHAHGIFLLFSQIAEWN